MKILYTIYGGSGHNSGGHYHSLNQVSIETGKAHEVRIVTLGSATSPVFQDNPYFTGHFKSNRSLKGIIKLNRELRDLTKEFTPDLIHCFDTDSLNLLLPLSSLKNYPIVLNKCGGPNPAGKNYQHAQGIIVFSAENYNWFKNNKNYRKEIISLIPNRIKKLHFLSEKDRVEQKPENTSCFLRVSRIGGAYEKTLTNTLKMLEELRKSHAVHLFLVGRIQDEKRYNEIKKDIEDKGLPVSWITDERASRGSDFLYLADFVIGTGRSFMEAISLGIPSLTPAGNSSWPVLVNKDNFETFFKTNFSERNVADELSLSTNKEAIEKLINDKNAYHQAKENAFELFSSYFSTDQINDRYQAVYSEVLSRKVNHGRLLRQNLLYLIKYYLR